MLWFGVTEGVEMWNKFSLVGYPESTCEVAVCRTAALFTLSSACFSVSVKCSGTLRSADAE